MGGSAAARRLITASDQFFATLQPRHAVDAKSAETSSDETTPAALLPAAAVGMRTEGGLADEGVAPTRWILWSPKLGEIISARSLRSLFGTTFRVLREILAAKLATWDAWSPKRN